MNDKIKELAEKLQRLADGQGNENEKMNAKRKLDELCKKYGFNTESFKDDKTSLRTFKWKDHNDKTILGQVITKVLNKMIRDISIYNVRVRGNLKPKSIGVYLTDSQYLEILYLYSFYSDLWFKEQKFFLNVFINKHYIFAECQPGEDPKRNREEEMRVRSALRAMQDATPHKAITHNTKGEK